MKKTIISIALTLGLFCQGGTDLSFYLGDQSAYDQSVPKPSEILGFEVGEWHVRHDLLVQYITALAASSDRAVLKRIGSTHENRALLNLVISAPENISRLETIRKNHVAVAKGEADFESQDLPLVVYLGYSIHGNEPSGSNASMLVAYHLIASQNVGDLLDHTIVILDPSLNPDGLSRFAQWANSHRGKTLVADRWHREHREGWPSGRTNHYWYDLNRDWLLLQHPESKARIAVFHQWRPNILGDFHEMGTGSSYFFQPGVPSRQNPLTPDQNLTLTRAIAQYHAKALDSHGQLYFSEQQFDDFYYGKGSTYPDLQGSIGILFEQASARGHLQENSYGTLSFPQTIKNQLTTSLSTLQAGHENKTALKKYQASFFPEARKAAKKHKVKAYLFGDSGETYRAKAMADILTQHQIQVHSLAKPVTVDGETWESGYVVLCDQNEFLLIKSLFDQVTTFNDNTFYDVSTWHFPSAFGVAYAELGGKEFDADLVGPAFNPDDPIPFEADIGADDLAFVMDWRHYLTPKYAYRLLKNGYRLRGATEPFGSQTSKGMMTFKPGALVIHQGIQDPDTKPLLETLREAAGVGIPVYGVGTGLTPVGHDLGSNSFIALQKPKVLVAVGSGVSSYEAGEMWHLLDYRYEMEVSLVEAEDINSNILRDYSHLILVNGWYSRLGDGFSEAVKQWVRDGGALIAIKGGAEWAVDRGLVDEKIIREGGGDQKEAEEDAKPKRIPYGERSSRRALGLISGTIFEADLDLTHPLGFGYSRPKIALFRNHDSMMAVSKDPFATAVAYTADPLKSGYVSSENLDRIRETASIIATSRGQGQVILMMDNPTFRGYWLGTQRLLLNALFFNDHIRASR